MYPWIDFLIMIVSGIMYVVFDPFYWLVLVLVALQYRQMNKRYKKMFGVAGQSLAKQFIMAMALGIAGGIIASLVLTIVGVSIDAAGLSYIWPLAVALAFIHMRFLCFAYAGGILAVCNLLTGFPEIDALQVIALVAVLHITESILIAISGSYASMPVFLRRRDGQIAGAFSLYNFWPVPLLVLTAVPLQTPTGDFLQTPDWWPILQTKLQPENIMYVLYPVVAGLGYADIAVTSTPAVKRRNSAIQLALYSIGLLFIVIAAVKYKWLQIIAAFAAPLGHEAIIQFNLYMENKGKALFVDDGYGLKILDTVPGSPARAAGLQTGDKLLELNGIKLTNGHELAYAIDTGKEDYRIKLLRREMVLTINIARQKSTDCLGIILVPCGSEDLFVELADRNLGLLNLYHRLRQGLGGKKK